MEASDEADSGIPERVDVGAVAPTQPGLLEGQEPAQGSPLAKRKNCVLEKVWTPPRVA